MKIKVHLNLKKPWEKYIHVTYQISLSQTEMIHLKGDLILNFPSWTPGSYLLREHAGLVSLFDAQTAKGKKLDFEKIHKSQWKIKCGNQRQIVVTYRLYANLLNVRGLYADHQMVFANPCAVFFHPEGTSQHAVELKIETESGWPIFLEKKAKKQTYNFADFDELYDTPIFTAKTVKTDGFRVGKTQVRLVYWGYSAIELKRVATELKKIIAKQVQIFGEHPCQNYLFQVIFGNNLYGGLEHRASSTNMFDGALLKKPEKFKDILSLLAHEHFHLWNVKRIRPRALGPFNYLQEAYTRELWIAEGFTRFYDDHSLVRTGLYKPQEYLDLMAEAITKESNQKAYRVDPVAEASFDAWIRYYRPDENQSNTGANYYLKGGLIALLLDLQILHKTNGKFSIDNVMLDLYRLYKKRPELGFDRDEFFAFVESYTQESSAPFIQKFITGTERLPLAKALVPFGVQLSTEKASLAPYYFGATFKQQDKAVLIANIDEDGPAFQSDLQTQDEILAIGARRLDSLDGLNHLLDVPNVKVLFCRNGQIYETAVAMSPSVKTTVKLKIRPHLTTTQKRLLTRFLRTPYE